MLSRVFICLRIKVTFAGNRTTKEEILEAISHNAIVCVTVLAPADLEIYKLGNFK